MLVKKKKSLFLKTFWLSKGRSYNMSNGGFKITDRNVWGID